MNLHFSLDHTNILIVQNKHMCTLLYCCVLYESPFLFRSHKHFDCAEKHMCSLLYVHFTLLLSYMNLHFSLDHTNIMIVHRNTCALYFTAVLYESPFLFRSHKHYDCAEKHMCTLLYCCPIWMNLHFSLDHTNILIVQRNTCALYFTAVLYEPPFLFRSHKHFDCAEKHMCTLLYCCPIWTSISL